jgi:hypothetical protein
MLTGLAFTILALLALLREARLQSSFVPCAHNLKVIGTEACLFAMDHPISPLADLGELMLHGNLPPETFICPETKDTPATGSTPQAIAHNLLNEKGHLSYVWIGEGMMNLNKLDSLTVLAYEPLTNHSGEGMHVLYADGRSLWLSAWEATSDLAELVAGHNPPRPKAERQNTATTRP